jgi:hypothetical protein
MRRDTETIPFRPLSAGTKLGPYEVIARIGKGGMGEAYRARITHLTSRMKKTLSGDSLSRRILTRRRQQAYFPLLIQAAIAFQSGSSLERNWRPPL